MKYEVTFTMIVGFRCDCGRLCGAHPAHQPAVQVGNTVAGDMAGGDLYRTSEKPSSAEPADSAYQSVTVLAAKHSNLAEYLAQLERINAQQKHEIAALYDAIACLKDFVEGKRHDADNIAAILNGAQRLSNKQSSAASLPQVKKVVETDFTGLPTDPFDPQNWH